MERGRAENQQSKLLGTVVLAKPTNPAPPHSEVVVWTLFGEAEGGNGPRTTLLNEASGDSGRGKTGRVECGRTTTNLGELLRCCLEPKSDPWFSLFRQIEI
jgi:hypothetical protein